jgi:CDP-glucose 4,6-dehydratase
MADHSLDYYKGKKVFLTGHTGFKGSWLSFILLNAGAEVTGYALEPPTEPSLFDIAGLERDIYSVIGDIRDRESLQKAFTEAKSDIIIHMAAQPIVRDSYHDPVGTYETNVMGTVNILECVRSSESAASFLNVTTDKVYENKEWAWGYRESDPMNGYDPYSNSKSCSELVTSSYRNSFFADSHIPISTARAGNVIGGGDFAKDRIIPDCVRAALSGKEIIVRNPHSTRPYQHVLEPLFAYLLIAREQAKDGGLAGSYNVGPDDADCVETQTLVDCFCRHWEREWGGKMNWKDLSSAGPHEANFLKLDCSLIKSVFGWRPVWTIDKAVAAVVEWTRGYHDHESVHRVMLEQLQRYQQSAMADHHPLQKSDLVAV